MVRQRPTSSDDREAGSVVCVVSRCRPARQRRHVEWVSVGPWEISAQVETVCQEDRAQKREGYPDGRGEDTRDDTDPKYSYCIRIQHLQTKI